jgi:hypothetical protein
MILRSIRWTIRLVVAALIFGSIGYIAFTYDFSGGRPVRFGVTFSPIYAEHLGLDWRQAYTATLDELGVRALRIPVYWSTTEPLSGKHNFEDVDWMLDQAAQRDAKVTLAIGMRVPRWPECHQPAWVMGLSPADQRTALFNHLTTVVTRYANRPEITMWQVENEPMLGTFGICPPPDKQLFRDEVALVRGLDARPILTTDSGELGTWLRVGDQADVFGTTLYRIVWNKHTGFFDYWFVPPAFYRWKADLLQLVHRNVKQVIISELQMEPWAVDKPITQMTLAEQQRSFNLERFHAAINYAQRTGMPEVYMWGVEYWYWLKQQGQPDIWEAAQSLW